MPFTASTIQESLTSPVSGEKALVSILLAPLIVTFIGLTAIAKPVSAIDAPSVDEQTLVELTNTERTFRGLSALRFNPRLSQAAEAKAADMLANGYFEHISPSGKTPWVFIEGVGYNYVKAGENLAIDFTTVTGPVPAWMDSPTHKANILKPDYEEIGIAEVKGIFKGRETTIVVQMFGTRAFSVKDIIGSLIK